MFFGREVNEAELARFAAFWRRPGKSWDRVAPDKERRGAQMHEAFSG
ncbi:MAG: hypothetical protein RLZZ399_1223 [Verrucomicrobiota bacterium]|jgi:hypothetical protein